MFKWHWEALQTIKKISNKPFFPHLKYWVNKKDTLGYERKFENRNKLFWIFFF